jgi:hypothetical protein
MWQIKAGPGFGSIPALKSKFLSVAGLQERTASSFVDMAMDME